MKVRSGNWFLPLPLLFPTIFSGALLSIGFAPVSFAWASFFSLVPLIAALYRGSYPPSIFFKSGYVFGVAYFLALLWWVVRLSPYADVTIPWILTPALVLLVLYLGLYPALVFWLLGKLGRQSPPAVLILGPALWALAEMIRSSGELGFSWGAIGYALSQRPALMQGAAWVGVFGLGALVVFTNLIFGRVFLTTSIGRRAAYALLGVFVIALMEFGGRQSMKRFERDIQPETVRVAVVQPNVDLKLKWEPTFTDSTFRLIDRLARAAAQEKPKLIVFPETAAPVYVRYESSYRTALQDLATELAAAIFIGFLDARYDGPGDSLNIYNSSGVFLPRGGWVQYDKMHLLPFGEAIPFAWKFRGLAKFNFGQANFEPGPPAEPIPSDAGPLGPLICFESIFSGPSRQFVSKGAEMLVNITNDGWFDNTPGPFQHKNMSIFRAVENRRHLLRSANTGVTMIVDPLGRVLSSLPLASEGVLVEDIPRSAVRTFYTRYGDLPVLLGSLVLIASGAALARRSKFGRGSRSGRR